MSEKKVLVYLFYDDASKPQVESFDYVTDFHCDGCLSGYLRMADKDLRNPFLVVMYVENSLYGFVSYKNREERAEKAVK